MPLTAGTRFGPFEILAPLGAGGMGEVYRATDTRLGRHVALKLLPPAFHTDPERSARFEREAKLLASVNHPHIAAIYGLESVAGVQAIAMELVDGETLADRLKRGRLPIAEALRLACQLTEALEAAHSKGVIHRDLKPSNVALAASGDVKVLDFGLAKAIEGERDGAAAVTNSPTVTNPVDVTGASVLLGTAAYMAPEQARSRPADKRSDIWAFGCVLYEMLTGRRPFEGETVTETLAKVMEREPDWAALPADTPAAASAALRACLRKDARQRFHDIVDVRLALDGALLPLNVGAATARPRSRLRRGLPLVTAAALLFAGWLTFVLNRDSEPTVPPSIGRFVIETRGPQPVASFGLEFTIASDGRSVAYVGRENGRDHLYRRAFDNLVPARIPHTEGARAPVFSPDGRWLAFIVTGTLQKVSLEGGTPINIARGLEERVIGSAWLNDDTIVYGTTAGLWRVSSGGGRPELLTRVDASKNEQLHVHPRLLPDSRTLLYGAFFGAAAPSELRVRSLETGEERVVLKAVTHAFYVSPGYLVYSEIDERGITTGAVWATRFDARRLTTIGAPVRIFDAVRVGGNFAQLIVSLNGTLVYQPGLGMAAPRGLMWVDLQGREEPLSVEARPYVQPSLSPDGTRIVVDARQGQAIWMWDVRREALDRVTFDSGVAQAPLWLPDGRRIVYSTSEPPTWRVMVKSVDSSAAAEELFRADTPLFPVTVSRDGGAVVIRREAPTGNVLERLSLGRDTETVTPVMVTSGSADVSPDVQWLAYAAVESGRSQIFVRSFSDPSAGRILVSPAGGSRPMWSRSGRELFYAALDDRTLMAVDVAAKGAEIVFGKPRPVFAKESLVVAGNRSFDISPDGRRFLMLSRRDAGQESFSSLVVVLNFVEELKAQLQ